MRTDVLAIFTIIWANAGQIWAATTVPVVHFQSDGQFSNSSVLRWTPDFEPELDDLTFCMRANLNFLRGSSNYVLSYATPGIDNTMTASMRPAPENTMKVELCKLKYQTGECINVIMEEFEHQVWNHFCFVYSVDKTQASSVTTHLEAFLNGDSVAKKSMDLPVSGATNAYRILPPGGTLLLGQDQDFPGGGFNPGQAFSGKISQVSLWDRALTAVEVSAIGKCNSTLDGNVVAWGNLDDWEATDTDEDMPGVVPLADLCNTPPDNNKLIITSQIPYTNFRDYCDILHGEIPVVNSKEELGTLHASIFDILAGNEASDWSGCRISDEDIAFHIGQVYDNTTGLWRDPYRNKIIEAEAGVVDSVVSYKPTSPSDTCAYAWGKSGIESKACDVRLVCGVCELPRGERLMVKGLCDKNVNDELEFDRLYYPHGIKNGRPYFKGIQNSHIYYENNTQTWRIQSLRRPDKYLSVISESPIELPLGTVNWTLSIRNAVCKGEAESNIELTLSNCFPDKYTCDSGHCIPLSDKCNTEIDCSDKSDEINCDYLRLGSNYAKELIPRDESGDIFIVYLNVSVLAIPSIETVSLSFTTDFYLNLRWYDLRIDFRDLNNITSLNSLDKEDKDALWTPRLGFVNALGPLQTAVDEMTTGVLVREDDPLPEDPSLSIEAMLFSGRRNSIYLTREYYNTYSCDFDLRYYPFDTQMCTMIFEVQGKTDDYVRLEKDGQGIEFLGGRLLVEYEIQLEELTVKSENRISRGIVKIVFRRRMEFHVTNTFLQVFFLILVGYLSLFFDVDNFTDRIMVTLTTMLVVATIMSSIQASLPKTAYYKFIDTWLMFSMCMLVLIMTLHTYVAHCCFMAKNQKFSLFSNPKPKPKVVPGPNNKIALMDNNRKSSLTGSALPPYRSRSGSRRRQTRDFFLSSDALNHPLPPELLGDSEDNDILNYAKKVNRFSKVFLLTVVLVFNAVFWTLALNEYLLPAEYYLDKEPQG